MSDEDFNYELEEEDKVEEFICPECGSKEPGEEMMLSKLPPTEKSKNPWDSVMQQIECNECKMIIPTHLGERWEGISYEKAQNEWKSLYKKNSKKQKF